jgi:hypothetical protein
MHANEGLFKYVKCYGWQCHGVHSFECSSMYLTFSVVLI